MASEVAQVSTRNNEEISRKFAMTNVELERTNEKTAEAKTGIQVNKNE